MRQFIENQPLLREIFQRPSNNFLQIEKESHDFKRYLYKLNYEGRRTISLQLHLPAETLGPLAKTKAEFVIWKDEKKYLKYW